MYHTVFTLDIFLTLTVYKPWHPLICTILFDLADLSKKPLFKDLIREIYSRKINFQFVTLTSNLIKFRIFLEIFRKYDIYIYI